MIGLAQHTKVYLAREPIDFRKQIDGLALTVQELLALEPMSAHLFVFRNRRADKLKVLYWHGNGFCLLYKRLEKGRFRWPRVETQAAVYSMRELEWLLEGLNLEALSAPRPLNVTRV